MAWATLLGQAAGLLALEGPTPTSVHERSWSGADADGALRQPARPRLRRRSHPGAHGRGALRSGAGHRARGARADGDVWPAGAWLVTTETAGRWWVWEYGATAPADEVALRLENRRLASGAPEQVAVVRADDGRLRTAGAPLASTRAVAPFLLGWGLIVLAVVLPGLVPVLAAYGAAHGVTSGDMRTPLHALLFVLPAAGLWIAAGVSFSRGARSPSSRLSVPARLWASSYPACWRSGSQR